MQNRHNLPKTIKENIIDSVGVNLQYNELVYTEKQALDTAESHFYDYMFPTIRDTIETYRAHQIEVEKIEIDLGSVELRDIPQKLEMKLKEVLEKHISDNNEHTRHEREISVLKKSRYQHMIDFLCQEQLPWTEEPEFFEPETWWNENLQKLLSAQSDLQALYKRCQSEVASLYRLLAYSNKSVLIQILTKWITDDELIPRQLTGVLGKVGLTTEHEISLKIKELTKPQIELLLITVLSIKEHSNSIILKNATNVLKGIIQKTFNYTQELSEENLLKDLLNIAYTNANSSVRHSDDNSAANTDISTADTNIHTVYRDSLAMDTDASTAETNIHAVNRDMSVADTDASAADINIHAVNRDISVADTDASTAETNIHAVNRDMSVADTDASAADINIHAVNRDISVADTDASAAETNIHAVNKDVSVADTGASAAETNIHAVNKDVSVANTETSAAETKTSTVARDTKNALIQRIYSEKEKAVANNNEGRVIHRHYENTLEHNREIEENTQEFSTGEIKTDEQIKMLLHSLSSDMRPNSVYNNYDTEAHKRYSTDVAGIVLLHPFLANYFRQVKLLDKNNQFISLEKQIHAVHLLRYLTGKRERHHSHLLNVEKIICGLSPTFPIPSKYNCSEIEKKEAQDMFAAIKQYWKSISKTSIEGIQTSFIHRQGIITFEEPYWLIRVEGSTLDILMDDLPWEMSMLMFPWMDRNILIEWQSAN